MNPKPNLTSKAAGLRRHAKHELRELGTKQEHGPMMAELYRRAKAQLRKHRQHKQAKADAPKSESDPKRLLHELQVHQVELEMQNAELQESRDRTETLLEKYTDLYDFAPVGYFTLTAGGNIQLVNLTGTSLVGLERSRLVGQSFARLVAAPQRPAFDAFLKKIIASQTRQTFEFELVRPGRPARIVNIEAQRLLNGQECRVAMVDITARKQAEDKVRLSEVRYRRLFEATHDGVLLLDPATRKITDANPFMTKLLGYSHTQLVGKELFEIGLLQDEAASQEMFQELKRTHEVRYEDLPLKSKGGRHQEVEVVANLYRENGHTVIQCNVRDITARKKSEQDLVEKARLLDLTHDAIIVRDLEGHVRYWNHGAEELYGWSRAEALGKISHLLLQTEFPIPLKQMTAELHRTDRWIGELVHTKRDGQRITVLARKTLDRDRHGKPAAVLENLTDITQRKAAEESLRKSEERFRAFVTASSDIMYRMSPDWAEMRQLEGRNFIADMAQPSRDWLREYIHPADQARVLAVINEAVRTKTVFQMEHQVRRVDGTLGWTFSRAVPLLDARGKIVEWFGAASDVTERKRAEVALRASEKRFRAAVGVVSSLLWTNNPEGLMEGEQPGWGNFTGQTLKEYQGYGWTKAVHPKDAPPTVAAWKRAVAKKSIFDFEHRVRRHDGEWRLCSVHAVPLLGEDGRIREWVGVHTDITERKQDEDAQRRLAVMTASNRKLESEIVRRQAVEKALQASEQEQRDLLKQSQQMQAQLRQLSHQILHAQEEERKRISRELHDEIAQTLVGINVHLAALTREAAHNPKDIQQKIAKTQLLVAKTVGVVHQFARELRPATLDDLGLIPALQAFMQEFKKQTGIHIRFKTFTSGRIKELTNATRTTFFRVAQEALTNVTRHAQASVVDVTFEKLPGALCLKIKDDGKSFQAQRVMQSKRNTRLGLLGMRERLEMVGGEFSIQSAPGQGTTVRALIPHGKAAGGGGGGGSADKFR